MFRSVADTPRNRLRLRRPVVTISEHKNTAIWTTIICLCSFMDYIILSDSSNRVWSRKKLRSDRHSHNIPAVHDAIASAKTKIAWPTFPASLCLFCILLFCFESMNVKSKNKKKTNQMRRQMVKLIFCGRFVFCVCSLYVSPVFVVVQAAYASRWHNYRSKLMRQRDRAEIRKTRKSANNPSTAASRVEQKQWQMPNRMELKSPHWKSRIIQLD